MKRHKMLFVDIRYFVFYIISIWSVFGINVKAADKYSVERYGTNEGLSQNAVMYINQDQKGYLWIATWDGLDKFDGSRFSVYKSNATSRSSLLNNRINSFSIAKNGYLWVSTYDNRIYRFNPNTEVFQDIPHSLPEYQNLNIKLKGRAVETSNGDIWLISQNQGCFRVITDPKTKEPVVQHFSVTNNEHRISNDNVQFVSEDDQKNIWIGTDNGLNRVTINPNDRMVVKISPFLQARKDDDDAFNGNRRFNSFTESGRNLWFSSENGIYQYDKSTHSFAGYLMGHSIIATRQYKNKLYVLDNREGLVEFDVLLHTVKTLVNRIGLSAEPSLFIDKYGLVWYTLQSAGVGYYNTSTGSSSTFVNADPKSTIIKSGGQFMFENHKGELWCVFSYGEFCRYNRQTNQMIYFNNNAATSRLFSDVICSVFFDKNDDLWLGTYRKGIYKYSFHTLPFRFIQPLPSSLSNDIRSIHQDRMGRLWAGTRDGKLLIFDRNNQLIRTYPSGDGSGYSGPPYAILVDRKGNVWIGTKGNGLFKGVITDPKTMQISFTHYQYNPDNKNAISGHTIYSILEDRKGRIWIGVYGGGINLVREGKEGIRFLNSGNGLDNYPIFDCDKIRHLAEDGRGNIWVATTNGVVVMSENQKSNFNYTYLTHDPQDPESLPGNNITNIFRDHQNRMWLATFGGGLACMEQPFQAGVKPKFKVIGTRNLLNNDIILNVTEDKAHKLWFTSENLLTQYDPQSGKIQNYGEADGLTDINFSETEAIRRYDGNLLFPTFNGILVVDPKRILLQKGDFYLDFVEFRSFNEIIPILRKEEDEDLDCDKVKLKYDQSSFTIEFAGVGYHTPAKLQYAYRLKGLDKEWTFAKNERRATYTNIPPGKYYFQVKCSATGDFNNAEVKELLVVVRPPFWKTWWAYLFYLALLGGLAYVGYRLMLFITRIKNKIKVEQAVSDLKLKVFTNISHELRTPLSLIMGTLENLLSHGALDKKAKDQLVLAEKNSRRMLRHINQILDFQKTESRKMRLRISEVEIVEFMQSIYTHFKQTADDKKIHYHFKTDAPELDVWIDPYRIDIVIFNLLSNAFKFTPEGRSISVEVVTQTDNVGWMAVKIQDNGVGISDDKLRNLFERFGQSASATKELFRGAGIGLSLCKELIELHGGRIDVDSHENQGALFTVWLQIGKEHFNAEDVDFETESKSVRDYLPYYQSLEAEKITETQVSAKLSGDAPKIVIAEDDPDLREFLRISLDSMYQVYTATNGEEALRLVNEVLPDIVLTDLMMPVMDGIELTGKIKQDFRTSHIPVVLLTAKTELESSVESYRAGADAFVVKPFSVDYLLVRIQNLLEQRRKLFERFDQKPDQTQKKMPDLSPSPVTITDKDEKFLRDVIKIVEDNMMESDFDIDKIASSTTLGRTTFYNKLKGLTGMSPVEFVRDIRVKRALQYLESGQYSVSEAAYQAGFNNPHYFSQCFKKKYGCSPSEFLKQRPNE